MKRLSLTVMLVSLLGVACAKGAGSLGPAPTGASTSPGGTGTPAPTPSPTATATASPSAGGRTISLQVWFVRNGKLFLTGRDVPATQAVGRAALNELLAGPSDAERSAGVTSQVPSGTTLLGLEIHDGIAFVDFSAEFRGSDIPPIRVGQVVWTTGQFSTVDQVVIKVNGGEIYETPQTTDEYERFLPAISVQSPTIGETVSSPVAISGSANVFEATVSLRILDENGHEIARGFTNATCGTGCRGSYSTTLAYHVDHDQAGTVEVFESSAKDGSPINVVSIPVTLTA
jgi:Immunoglobulin-like domain of bacterial spore germination/Sporulation and spore germination